MKRFILRGDSVIGSDLSSFDPEWPVEIERNARRRTWTVLWRAAAANMSATISDNSLEALPREAYAEGYSELAVQIAMPPQIARLLYRADHN